MSGPVDLAILYAAPLAYGDAPITALDFEAERERLFNSFAEADRAIRVRVEAATADHLRTLLTLGCRALHYTGHGAEEFLAFEDGRGGVHALDVPKLRTLFAAGDTDGVDFVFVSACHSRAAGEAFAGAGVPHVVCVRLEEPVYDIAAREFARAFYLALLRGKTVRQAFDIGRAAVSTLPDLPETAKEHEKFLLLPEDGNHDRILFESAAHGAWIDSTPPRIPHTLPSLPKLVGREVDMQSVVGLVLKHRLVTIRGGPGIGKTSLATAAGCYLADRRMFDGVYFVKLRNVEKGAEGVRAAVAVAVGLEAAPDDETVFRRLRQGRWLLLFDNCEDPLHAFAGEFRAFLEALIRQTPHVHVLATSRQLVGFMRDAPEKPFQLTRLGPEDAARLFVSHAPSGFPFSGDGLAAFAKHFAEHPVMKFLAGHPHAIALAAPLLQDCSLGELEERLAAEPVDTLVVAGEGADSEGSISRSLGVSVNYLRERHPEAVRLFALFGLLPGGALPEDLDAIWGEGWKSHALELAGRSLIERNDEHLSTYPVFGAYAKRLLTREDLTLFREKAARHFAGVSEELYELIHAGKTGLAQEILSVKEPNLWATIESSGQPQPGDGASTQGRIGATLASVLLYVGRLRDGLKAATIGLKASRNLNDRVSEANTLQAMGDLKRRMDDLEGAGRDYAAALPLYRQIENRLGEANTLKAMGDLKRRIDDLEGAGRDYAAALPLYRQIEVRLGEANTLQAMGDLKRRMADLEGAGRDYAAALPLYRQIEARLGEANTLKAMGQLATASGEIDTAFEYFRSAMTIYSEIDDRLGAGGCLDSMARAAAARGDHATAIHVFQQSITIARTIGYRHGEALSLESQARGLTAMSQTLGALAAFWQAREIRRAISDPSAARLDKLFAATEAGMEPAQWRGLLGELETRAEEIRLEAVSQIPEPPQAATA